MHNAEGFPNGTLPLKRDRNSLFWHQYFTTKTQRTRRILCALCAFVVDFVFMSKGLVIIITGQGKGKTTSALGQAFRAIGQGLKVLMIQFLKTSTIYGEIKTAKRLYPDFEIIQTGKTCTHSENPYDCANCNFECHVDTKSPSREDIDAAKKAFIMATEKIMSGKYDMIILDEINYAIDYGLIPLIDVLNLIHRKPESLHLILTGRNAPIELVREADLVSEILEIKHPYQQGIISNRGIDY